MAIEDLEAGKIETMKSFEDVTTRNVRASVEFSTTTREIVRTLEERVRILDEMVVQSNEKFVAMQQQLAMLQMKIYTMSNNNE